MSQHLKSLIFVIIGAILIIIFYSTFRKVDDEIPINTVNYKYIVDSLDTQLKLRDVKIHLLESDKKIQLKTIDSLQLVKNKMIINYNITHEKIVTLPYYPSANAMRDIFSKSGIDTTR